MRRLRLRESNIGTDPFTPISQSFTSPICLGETLARVETLTTNRGGGSINGPSSNFRHVSAFLPPAGLRSDVSPEPDGFHSSCSAGWKHAAKRQRGAARYWSLVSAGSGGPDELDVVRPVPAPHLSPVAPARGSPFPHFSWNKSLSGCPN